MLEFYDDNDFINIYGRGSDRRYTNGSLAGIFYNHEKQPSSVFYKLSLKAGGENITTFGWSIFQKIITPSNTEKRNYQPDDYFYAGALYAIHSLHFANPNKKINVQTDWIAGVMGPAAFAKQTQAFVHRLTGYENPKGWKYQLPNDLLLNYNVSAAKKIAGNKLWELIAQRQIFIGSMLDGVSLTGRLRFGKLTPYFNGKMQQIAATAKNFAISVSLIPGIDFIFYNALLQGGLFNSHSPLRNQDTYHSVLHRKIIKAYAGLQLMISFRSVAVSFTQKTLSNDFKGMSGQNIGNLSLYFKLR